MADAERAVAAAERTGRTLMVGHLLEYHPGVQMLKALVDEGELGDIYCVYGNRVNLGQLRSDENALWSLGAHDVSVLLHIVEEEPYEVSAHGESYLREGVEDVVFCFLRFPSGVAAHLHLSWLDPHKERRFTIVGSKRMATFDDMAIEGKLTVYDKGFDEDTRSYGEYIARSGDMFCPRVPSIEPLRLECEHFLEAIRDGNRAALGRPQRPARGARARAAAGRGRAHQAQSAGAERVAPSARPRRAARAARRFSARTPPPGSRRPARRGSRTRVLRRPGTGSGRAPGT